MSQTLFKTDLKSRFAGVFAANPTPLTDRGEIHEEGLRGILEDNMSYGVHGFWIAGTAGEGPFLSEQQRDAVARIAGETTKGRALSIMNVGAITTESAKKGAQSAVQAGCAAIACLPPFFPVFRNEASIIDHYKAVADSAEGLPIFAYNIPVITQVEFDPALMENLRNKVPSLIGLKHSAHDLSMIQHWVDMELACFSGFGRLPLPALSMGAVGIIDSPLSIAPWLYVELYNAWKRGQLDIAQTQQTAVQSVNNLIWRYNAVPDVCKAILGKRLGIDCGQAILPNNRLSPKQRSDIIKVAEDMGLLNHISGSLSAT